MGGGSPPIATSPTSPSSSTGASPGGVLRACSACPNAMLPFGPGRFGCYSTACIVFCWCSLCRVDNFLVTPGCSEYLRKEFPAWTRQGSNMGRYTLQPLEPRTPGRTASNTTQDLDQASVSCSTGTTIRVMKAGQHSKSTKPFENSKIL